MKKFKDVQNRIKKSFEDAAKTCDSDPNYAGLFSEILQIRNESLAVLSENYCTAKYIKKINIIDMTAVDVNSNKINTTSIDCIAIIQRKRKEKEAEMRKNLAAVERSDAITECLVQETVKMFDTSLALEVNERVGISLEQKKTQCRIHSYKIP